jgi:hypothetical protein
MRWAGNAVRMGGMRNSCKTLGGKPEGNRPIGRDKRRFEDNIRMDLRGIWWEVGNWMCLAQWRAVVNTVMNLLVP